jgi:hypothetical protein
MTSHSEFYEKNLYPLQDGVLKCVSGCGTDFFLTGGTALNRAYRNSRYSDDLDFFLSASSSFAAQLEAILEALPRAGFKIDETAEALRTGDFCTIVVFHESNPESLLKLDFVNDIVAHYDGFLETPIFSKTDSPRNILSNKLTALFRFEAKDVADIHSLCLGLRFNWSDIMKEARTKEAGLEAPLAAEILAGIPLEDFRSVRWIRMPEWEPFRRDLRRIAEDMLAGGSNSLFDEGEEIIMAKRAGSRPVEK